jgi:hypothetical protein
MKNIHQSNPRARGKRGVVARRESSTPFTGERAVARRESSTSFMGERAIVVIT